MESPSNYNENAIVYNGVEYVLNIGSSTAKINSIFLVEGAFLNREEIDILGGQVFLGYNAGAPVAYIVEDLKKRVPNTTLTKIVVQDYDSLSVHFSQ
jgi:hypothetical protein